MNPSHRKFLWIGGAVILSLASLAVIQDMGGNKSPSHSHKNGYTVSELIAQRDRLHGKKVRVHGVCRLVDMDHSPSSVELGEGSKFVQAVVLPFDQDFISTQGQEITIEGIADGGEDYHITLRRARRVY